MGISGGLAAYPLRTGVICPKLHIFKVPRSQSEMRDRNRIRAILRTSGDKK